MTNQTQEQPTKLENIAGGPLKLNQDGTFNLDNINYYLNEHGLKLEIQYYPKDNRFGFSIYREKK
ncbi:MAG TPA: hypothetical protein PK357_01090 [Candidatus Pacearchaeota archaeon]|jgi:hypothetical protein|nr:hypothetical protein [Candidatus Pacearchaeota archaeon]